MKYNKINQGISSDWTVSDRFKSLVYWQIDGNGQRVQFAKSTIYAFSGKSSNH